MSLKENVDYVKKELDNEEKFLESFVKIERFYKNNKKLLIGLAIVILVAVIGLNIKSYTDKQTKNEANIAFSEFLKDNKNQTALETLKTKNEKLYNLALYLKAKNEKKSTEINIKFLDNIAAYQKAIKEENLKKLNDLSMEKDFLLKEFAIFNKALIETKNGKYSDAKATLKLIPKESQAYELVKILNHYLLTK